ncbi:MAG: hypothetical protein Q9228_000630 [Teloschistes exilis]
MASNQYSSQHSSSGCSQTFFTPSEPFFTPSNSIHNPSQPSLHGEHEVSDSSQSDGAAQGQDQAMTRFFSASGSRPIEVPTFPPEQEQYQDMSGAPNDDQFGQHIQPNYRPPLYHDTGAQFKEGYVAANLHNAYSQDQLRAAPALNAVFSQDIARIPQPAFLAGRQFYQTSQAADYWIEPSIDLSTGMQYYPEPATVVCRNESFPQHGTANQGMYYHGVPSNQQRIDPPPSPDPAGPPSQASNGRESAPEGVEGVKNRGRRTRPLSEQSAQNARSIRETGGSCWNCTLKRDRCQFENGDEKVCIDCKKMTSRSLLPICIRAKLPDFITCFIPASLARQHDHETLLALQSKGMRGWLRGSHIPVLVTWGYFRPIKFNTQEIVPRGTSLLYQNQWRLNQEGGYGLVQVPSPPLGMYRMAVEEWRIRLNGYLEGALEETFWGFPAACLREGDSRVERDFLIPIFEYHNQTEAKKEKKLVHQCLKLIVLTYIMTRSLTLVEHTKDEVYQRLRNPPPMAFGRHTCPRWLNRQIKFLLSPLHYELLQDILHGIQEALRLSNSKPMWAPLFASMVILAVTTESQQVAVRCKEALDKQEKTIVEGDGTAKEAIKVMDERFTFLCNLFHQKYRTHLTKGFNPLFSVDNRNRLDTASRSLAAEAANIVEKYRSGPFLIARQALAAPESAEQPQTARLIAKFLLLFHPPEYQHSHQPAEPDSMQQ